MNTMSPTTTSSSGIRLVISWGVATDLDNHVKVYDSNGNEICHVYYSNRNCLGTHLDVDSIGVNHSSIHFCNEINFLFVFRDMDQKQLQLETLPLTTHICILSTITEEPQNLMMSTALLKVMAF